MTVAVGFTVMVKLVLLPPHALALVVTVIVAVIGAAVALVAMKLGILPVPLAARPMATLLFVQLYVVVATLPVKFTALVALPAQSTWLGTPSTVGFGFTVIVKLTGVPLQLRPLAVNTGVTVTVAVTGAVVLLTALKAPILPVPDAARPIEVLLLVQLYTVPGTGPAIVTAAVLVLLHTDWLAIAFTDGVGFTV